MVKSWSALVAFVAVWLVVACAADRHADGTFDPVGPASDTEVEEIVAAPNDDGVGTFGIIQTIKPQEQGLVVLQTGFDVDEVDMTGNRIRVAEHELAIGARHAQLQVQIRPSTEIWLKGELATVSDLEVGMEVLIVGRVTGAALHAEQIHDLADAAAPPDDLDTLPFDLPEPELVSLAVDPAAFAASVERATTSMCMGQRLPYEQPDVLEFQGCWGGPSAADHLSLRFIPVFCPFAGCVGIDRFSYTAALAGWNYAFPFEFGVDTEQNLVYNIPGEVDLSVVPLGAGDAVSFSGGLGLEFGIRFRWCGVFGCYNLGTVRLSAFSSIQNSSDPAPLTGEVLEIDSTSCPGVALIPIKGFPIDPLGLSFCQDLSLIGRPFLSQVHVVGGDAGWHGALDFGPQPTTALIQPRSMGVGVRYDDFSWVPRLTNGLSFRLTSFGLNVLRTPTIPLGSGDWHAITPGFPLTPFTVATDPLSPVNDLRYLVQPTTTPWFHLEVDPAPTLVSVVSDHVLEEGTPLTVWLREEYLDTPIMGEVVSVAAAGLAGSHDVMLYGVTDANGLAFVHLPPGEFALHVSYAGAETYVPSDAHVDLVTVYRPTSFVIWGGNPGGVVSGERCQFWGSGWIDQVIGGDYGGDPSFQGFALPLDASTWRSPPANAADRPDEMAGVISVIVTRRVVDHGAQSIGTIDAHAIVRVEDPLRYAKGSGQDMWGVVRMQLP